MDLSNATIGQLMIPADDLDRAVSFYRDSLGLPFLFAAPPHMAFFMCGSVRLLVGKLPPEQAGQRGSAVYFKVDDIHDTAATLKRRNVRFDAEAHIVHRTAKSELWLAEFTDSEGNRLALMAETPLSGH